MHRPPRPSPRLLPRLVALAALAAPLGGCLGSELAYQPRKGEDRPDPEKRAAEEAELTFSTALPVDVEQAEAERERGRREVRRIRGEVSRNPWNTYEDELVRVLGPVEAYQYTVRRPRPGAPGVAGEAGADGGGDED